MEITLLLSSSQEPSKCLFKVGKYINLTKLTRLSGLQEPSKCLFEFNWKFHVRQTLLFCCLVGIGKFNLTDGNCLLYSNNVVMLRRLKRTIYNDQFLFFVLLKCPLITVKHTHLIVWVIYLTWFNCVGINLLRNPVWLLSPDRREV